MIIKKQFTYDVLYKDNSNPIKANVQYDQDSNTAKVSRTKNMNYAAYIAGVHIKLFS